MTNTAEAAGATATVAPPTAAVQAAPAAAKPAATAPVPPPRKKFDLGDTLGLAKFKGVMIDGFGCPWEHPRMRTPAKHPDWVWREDQVFSLLLFWFASASSKSLKLIGHTGAGKSDLVLQWHAAFNLPLLYVVCNPKTEAGQLTGMLVPMPDTVKMVGDQPMVIGGGMKFVDGPLITAARHGLSVCLDEFNTLDPGEATGLNSFLEGKPFSVPETGETILPRPGFRIFATMNPKTPGYRGRQKQDMANDDRFVDMFVSYLPAELEIPLVEKVILRIAQGARMTPDAAALREQATRFVRIANDIREKYMGDSMGADALPCTMSTRTLLRWVEWTQLATSLKTRNLFDPGKSAAHFALRQVLSSRQEPEVSQALHTFLTTVTGEADT